MARPVASPPPGPLTFQYAEAVSVAGGDVDFEQPANGFLVGVAGNVAVEYGDGTSVVLPAMQAGIEHRHRIKAILQTGTTATGIVALW